MNKQERKAQFIARATAHFDTPEIRKQASDMWDKENGIEKDILDYLSSDKVIKWFSIVVITFLLTHIVIAIIR